MEMFEVVLVLVVAAFCLALFYTHQTHRGKISDELKEVKRKAGSLENHVQDRIKEIYRHMQELRESVEANLKSHVESELTKLGSRAFDGDKSVVDSLHEVKTEFNDKLGKHVYEHATELREKGEELEAKLKSELKSVHSAGDGFGKALRELKGKVAELESRLAVERPDTPPKARIVKAKTKK